MRTLTKIYAAKFPESPKSVADIINYFDNDAIKSSTGQTLRNPGERTTTFFKHAYEGRGFSVCIFVSDDVVDIIKTILIHRRLFFGDGTFGIVPYGEFKQLLIMSVDICGQVRIYLFFFWFTGSYVLLCTFNFSWYILSLFGSGHSVFIYSNEQSKNTHLSVRVPVDA